MDSLKMNGNFIASFQSESFVDYRLQIAKKQRNKGEITSISDQQ